MAGNRKKNPEPPGSIDGEVLLSLKKMGKNLSTQKYQPLENKDPKNNLFICKNKNSGF